MLKKQEKIAVVLLMAFIVWISAVFIEKTEILKVLSDVAGEALIETGIPAYMFVNNLEYEGDNGIFGAIVNDIYPMNEYLMANDYYWETDYSDGVITAGSGEVINIVESETVEEGSNTGSSAVGTEGSDSSGQAETAPPENVPASAEVAAAISRNNVTGKVYSKAQLGDYNFAKGFYTVTSITSLTNDIFKPSELINKDLGIKKDASKPQILIFHTHSQEGFTDSKAGDDTTTIVGVGDYLTKLLTEKYGYNVIHDRSVYDLVNGKLDRSKAYTYAQEGIDKILKSNPSIEVVIDLHRDGVAENKHLVTQIDGKQTAKIMFFNGLSYSNINGNIDYLYNPYRSDNLAMSLQMHLLGEAYYPGFLRNIYINAYRYCLHKRGRSMLIEAGAQTNTQQEVKNAMEPLADMLDKFLSGQKAY